MRLSATGVPHCAEGKTFLPAAANNQASWHLVIACNASDLYWRPRRDRFFLGAVVAILSLDMHRFPRFSYSAQPSFAGVDNGSGLTLEPETLVDIRRMSAIGPTRSNCVLNAAPEGRRSVPALQCGEARPESNRNAQRDTSLLVFNYKFSRLSAMPLSPSPWVSLIVLIVVPTLIRSKSGPGWLMNWPHAIGAWFFWRRSQALGFCEVHCSLQAP